MKQEKKSPKTLKYFELPIWEAKGWRFEDYAMFVIESLYLTIFPFLSGMFLIKTNNLLWLLLLIFPIYLKFKVSKDEKAVRKKRIYVR